MKNFYKRCLVAWWAMLSCYMTFAGSTYPNGFSETYLAAISNPVACAFTPDGRMLITESVGKIRVIKNNKLLPTPMITLSVNGNNEKGMHGIAIDPNFASNGFIYVYYSVNVTPFHNRLSRFTVTGDVADPTSEKLILDFPEMQNDFHNGGAMLFGNDGFLYVAVGDAGIGTTAPKMDTYFGKILRITPDGAPAPGNPFLNSTNEVTQRIWTYGHRNPYKMSIQRSSGKIYLCEVGDVSWEEINDITVGGGNYGWPSAEGISSNPAYINPIYAYAHTNAANQTTGPGIGCAITGGTFLSSNSNYPAEYQGKFFFLDFCSYWIDYINPIAGATPKNFSPGANGYAVFLECGPDGNLYYYSRNAGALYKITYAGSGPMPPVITKQPQSLSVSVGNAASFTVEASGSTPLQYQWKKNGIDIPAATNSSFTLASAQFTDGGNYSVMVSNANGQTVSNSATLTVTEANVLPQAQITSPPEGYQYRGGETISFSGIATDAEDGTLPASAFKWIIDFHHDTHTHPGPEIPLGSQTGNFTTPTGGETSANVYFRIYLEVTDSKGGVQKTYRDIYPVKSNLTLTSEPAGAEILLDGQPKKATYSTEAVSGMFRQINVNSPQIIDGKSYLFDRWEQGGSQNQTIEITDANQSFKVLFKLNPTQPTQSKEVMLVSSGDVWQYQDNGSDQGSVWKDPNFPAIGWKSGQTQLGYGDGDEKTVVQFGNDPTNKPITTYFRKKFQVTNVKNMEKLYISLLRDDGAVVFINGKEVMLSNMRIAPYDYMTRAFISLGQPNESSFVTYSIPYRSLVEGENTIAVEIHQSEPASSDMSFDLALKAQYKPTFVLSKTTFTKIDTNTVKLVASDDASTVFEPVIDMPSEMGFEEDIPTNTNPTFTIDAGSNPGLAIFPNPAQDELQIKLSNIPFKSNTLKGRIYDVQGRVVQTIGLQSLSPASTQVLNVAGLPTGQYLLELDITPYHQKQVNFSVQH